MPAKSEGVGEGRPNRALLRFVEREVQFEVERLIGVFKVDGWRYNAVLDGENAGNAFDGSRSGPNKWPVMDLVELMFRSYAWSPKTP